MGFPVKVTPKMYEQIKERAEERRITLQDALTEILTERQAAVEELQARYAELAGAFRRFEERSHRETAALSGQVETLRAEVRNLKDHLKQIGAAWKSWVPAWESIPQLQKSRRNLKGRVQSLETEAHHHLFQNRR